MMDDGRMGQTMRGATAPHRNTNGVPPSPDADELFHTLERSTAAIGAYLRAQVLCTPYLALGAAAVAGYVLGAGLPPRLAGLLVSMAGRSALGELIAGTLAQRTPQA